MENSNDYENITKYDEKYNDLWDLLIEHNIATENELQLISYINGWNIETLNDVLYVRTGYRDWEQFKECELNEED